MKVWWIRFDLVNKTLGLMAICLEKKVGKVETSLKMPVFWHSVPENPSSKLLPPLPLFWSWTWEKRDKWPGIRSLALVNVVFKPDFKFQPQQFKIDFPRESVQKTGIFKLVSTFPTFFRDIWPSILEFCTPNKTWFIILSSPKIWTWSVNQR